jgi:hypothetical protein
MFRFAQLFLSAFMCIYLVFNINPLVYVGIGSVLGEGSVCE